MSFISVKEVSKVFGARPQSVVALDAVSLEIADGEFVAVTGPSGSGKTTLLSILGAMAAPTSGEVVFDGISLGAMSVEALADFRARRIGFVFQQLHLMPYLTAIENVMLPLVISRRKLRYDAALAALQQVGLEGKARRLPGELSTGEQARVGIARALVRSPSLVLADEPTGNLDSRTGLDIVNMLQSANEDGRTVVLVTHDREIAGRAHRIIRLRDGRIAGSDE